MKVRMAQRPDAERLVALVNSAYRGDGAKKGWTTEADLLGGQRVDVQGMELLLNAPDSVILLAEDSEGFIGCVEVKSTEQGCYIGMLTVDPTLQNKGVGKILLEHAEEYAAGKGSPRAFMTVIGVREELIAWYERRGYRRTGVQQDFPTHDPRFGIPKVAPEMLRFEVLEKTLSSNPSST